MQSHQRLFLVPGTFGDWNSSRSPPVEEQQEGIIAKLNGYWDWATSEPLVAGISCWHWTTIPGLYEKSPGIIPFYYGVDHMPKVISRLKQLGDIIRGQLKSDDIARRKVPFRAPVFRPPVLVGLSAQVPCGEPTCRPHCPGCYAGNTPVVDHFSAVAPGVIVAPWTSGYPLGRAGNLAFAISTSNGASWSNRTVLPATGLLDLPNYPWVWTARPDLGLLASLGGCNASVAPGKDVAAQCSEFKCGPTASPAFATLTANKAVPPGISLSASCGQVEFRGFPHPLRPIGLLSGWGDDGGSPTITKPVRLHDGSLVMSIAMVTADEPRDDRLALKYPMNLVIWRSQDGGKLWQYLSVAVNHTHMPWAGPSEHDLSLLSDGKTLMMVMRTVSAAGLLLPAFSERQRGAFLHRTGMERPGRALTPAAIPGTTTTRPTAGTSAERGRLLRQSRALVASARGCCCWRVARWCSAAVGCAESKPKRHRHVCQWTRILTGPVAGYIYGSTTMAWPTWTARETVASGRRTV